MIQKRMMENTNSHLECCGRPMEELQVNMAEELLQEHSPVMTTSGGFAANIITVKVGRGSHSMTEEHQIKWIYLHTFQGGQLKFLKPGQAPEAVFALTEDDAYVYCDRAICKMGWAHCMFNCKRGFTAYAYCNIHGLSKYKF